MAVVNETFARAFWPEESPIGKRIRLAPAAEAVEIIGLAPDGKYQTLGEAPQLHLFLAAPQSYSPSVTVVLHTAGDPRAHASGVRDVVRRLDANLLITDLQSFEEHVGFALAPARAGAVLSSLAGGLAVLLAMIGLCGLLTFIVHQRRRYVGIRRALGASSAAVVALVAARSTRLVGLGVVLGLVVAVMVSLVLSSLLYGVGPTDAWAFSAVLFMMVIVTSLATALPVRQALRVDPMRSLRDE